MDEFRYELKIPKERVPVLIGKDGETKKRIESETESRLLIDSHEGDVFVSGSDAIKLLAARELINAVGRGFNPDIAFSLLKPDVQFESVQIQDFARNKNDELRLKGRVIGQEGKARRQIEMLTRTSMCVYGKTVSVIGEATAVSFARRAIIALLRGSTHAKVYRWLEKQRRLLPKD